MIMTMAITMMLSGAVQGDGLGRTADLMSSAAKLLNKGVSDSRVTDKQAEVVSILDSLIKQAENGERQGGSSKGEKQQLFGQREGKPTESEASSPAARSTDAAGASKQKFNLQPRAKPGASWGKMPPARRERILQAIEKTFPARYRQLVEQYYSQLGRKQ